MATRSEWDRGPCSTFNRMQITLHFEKDVPIVNNMLHGCWLKGLIIVTLRWIARSTS